MRAIKAEECQAEEHNLCMLLMREQLKYYQNQNNNFDFSVPNQHANVVSSGLSQNLFGSGLNNVAANNVPSMHSECIPSNQSNNSIQLGSGDNANDITTIMHVNAVSEVVGFENHNTVVSPTIQSNSAVTPISYGNTSVVPVSGTQSGSNFIPVVVQDAVVSQDISIHRLLFKSRKFTPIYPYHKCIFKT